MANKLSLSVVHVDRSLYLRSTAASTSIGCLVCTRVMLLTTSVVNASVGSFVKQVSRLVGHVVTSSVNVSYVL